MRPLLVTMLCATLVGSGIVTGSTGGAQRPTRPAGAASSAERLATAHHSGSMKAQQPAPASRSTFVHPLPGPNGNAPLARPLELPEAGNPGYGPGHRGVDLIGEEGQPVRAAGPGVIVYAGWLVDRNLISLAHADGLRTTYEPVRPMVVLGQRVTQGEPIGSLEPGHPGCAVPERQACLHWGARRDSEYLDPLRLLGHRRVRLLPWKDPG